MRATVSTLLGLLLFFPVESLVGQEPAAKDTAPQKPEAGKQVEQEFVGKKNPREKLGYLLYLPKDYSKKKTPLLIFLHGSGERGIGNLPLVKKHGPPKIVDSKPLSFIVVSPQCPAEQRWDAAVLSELLDEIVAKYSVDENRIYLTGLSMGGSGTWSLAASDLQRFAAIAPICGRGDLASAKKFTGLPTWIFCGAKDKQQTVQNAKDMANAITTAGGKAKLTIYPDLTHDCWTVTYENPEFYTWLLSHKKSL
jgi:predicted peptidase